MTDYNPIPDNILEPDDPISADLGIRWRDNPLAMFEGAPGAPRLLGKAVAKIGDVPVLTVTAADTASLFMSAPAIAGTLSTNSTANPPTVVARTITVISVTGTIRLRATHTGKNSRLSLYKNNVLVQAYTTGSSAARVNDVSAVPGDVFQWRHGTDNATVASVFSGASETASDGHTTITPIIPISEA